MDRAFNRRAFIEFGAAGAAFLASAGLGAATAPLVSAA